jgi:Tol biopolymer transport system component
VAFCSGATNLVDHDTNSDTDVFVHDILTGQTTRVSVASDGTQADCADYWFGSVSTKESISEDGRYVAFESWADNLVTSDTNNEPDIFVHDRLTGITTRVSGAPNGTQPTSWAQEGFNISKWALCSV